MKKIFRFDDINPNTDFNKLENLIEVAVKWASEVWLCYSPFSHDPKSKYHESQKNPTELEKERVFPSILKALSNYQIFYKVDKILDPSILFSLKEKYPQIKLVSHGLVHVDHRLLSKTAQEMSILITSSLVKSDIFIPPFNHYNKKTEKICKENGIQLCKFEQGWLHLKYNKFDPLHDRYYVHPFEITINDLQNWFKGK